MWRILIVCLAFAGYSAAPRAADCARKQESDAPEAYLEEARCNLLNQQYVEAYLAAERYVALRPGDSSGLEVLQKARQLLGIVKSAHIALPQPARGGLAGWVAVQAGHDSNVNSGTSAAEISLPLFRGLIVDIEEKLGEVGKRSSPFFGLHAGLVGTVLLGRTNRLRAHAAFGGRYNVNFSEYAPLSFVAGVEGEQDLADRFRVQASWNADQRWIGRHGLLDAQTIGLRGAVAFASGRQAGVFTSASDRNVPLFADQRSRELEQGLFLDAFSLRLALFQGSERAKNALRFLDRDFEGLSVRWSGRRGERGRIDIAFASTRSRYVEFSQLFLGRRLDELHELHLAYEHRLATGWTLTPRLIAQQNRSNVALTRFERSQLLAELRRDF